MIRKTIFALCIVALICGCGEQTSKEKVELTRAVDQKPVRKKSGILIEHMGYRGTDYIDSLGVRFNMRTNPFILTNDTTVPIRVDLKFSKSYDYPPEHGDEQYRVIPLPEDWARTQTPDAIYDSIFKTLPNHVNNPTITRTIQPGEKIGLGVATIYPKPVEECAVVPKQMFVHDTNGRFAECEWKMDSIPDSKHVKLGVELKCISSCVIIPCGEITYLDPQPNK